MNWYAIHSKPRGEHLAQTSLEREGIETFYPKLKRRKTIRRVRRWVTGPLFPSYIFARFDPGKSLRLVRYANGVATIVSFGGKPAIVEDALIELVRNHCTMASQPDDRLQTADRRPQTAGSRKPEAGSRSPESTVQSPESNIGASGAAPSVHSVSSVVRNPPSGSSIQHPASSIQTPAVQLDTVLLEPESFKVGDRVEIQTGPMMGMQGIFEKEMSDHDRVVILLDALAKGARVQLTRDQLEKVA